MALLRGQVLTAGGWMDGWVRTEDGRIADVGRGDPIGRVDAKGIIVPAFINAHTHLGDAVARGTNIPSDLAEAVGPGGHKHKVLAKTPGPKLVAGMRTALREAKGVHTGAVVDFREGGAEGVRQLRQAEQGEGIRVLAMARPHGKEFTRESVRALLAEADGIAISALRDVGRSDANLLASAARAAGKLFALHASEAENEPIDHLLELRPDHLVHMVHATKSDLARLREAHVGVVVCPRSNLRWAKRLPDVALMLNLGIPVGLGSDNAMLGPTDVLAEARGLLEAQPGLPPTQVLKMLCYGGRAALPPSPLPLDRGAPADLLVFAPRTTRPESAVLDPRAHVVHRERAAA